MKKDKKIKAEINVVPYIDVMLVLLIIFMITAPMLTQGIDVSLPKTTYSETVVPSQNSVFFIVSINNEGKIFLTNTEEEENSSESLSIRNLQEKIIDFEKLYTEKEIKIFIKGDEEVNYGKVVEVMDSLKKISKNKIGLMTEQVNP